MFSDESDDSDEEESDKLGSESGSDGTCGTGLGGFTRILGFALGIKLSADESCDGDRGSLAFPNENIGEVCTRESTSDSNIFSIAWIKAESWIDLMLVELDEMVLFDSVWFGSTWNE